MFSCSSSRRRSGGGSDATCSGEDASACWSRTTVCSSWVADRGQLGIRTLRLRDTPVQCTPSASRGVAPAPWLSLQMSELLGVAEEATHHFDCVRGGRCGCRATTDATAARADLREVAASSSNVKLEAGSVIGTGTGLQRVGDQCLRLYLVLLPPSRSFVSIPSRLVCSLPMRDLVALHKLGGLFQLCWLVSGKSPALSRPVSRPGHGILSQRPLRSRSLAGPLSSMKLNCLLGTVRRRPSWACPLNPASPPCRGSTARSSADTARTTMPHTRRGLARAICSADVAVDHAWFVSRVQLRFEAHGPAFPGPKPSGSG